MTVLAEGTQETPSIELIFHKMTSQSNHINLKYLATVMICGFLLWSAGGCGPRVTRPAGPLRYENGIITPINPDPAICSLCMGPYRDQYDSNDLVQDLVLGSMMSMQDFKPPAGQDGYVLSIAPLNKDSKSIPIASGRLTICLYRHPHTSQPLDPSGLLRMWQLEPYELNRFWARTRLLDCYILFLDWQEPPDTDANLLFAVVMEYQQGKTIKHACRFLSIPGSSDFKMSQE